MPAAFSVSKQREFAACSPRMWGPIVSWPLRPISQGAETFKVGGEEFKETDCISLMGAGGGEVGEPSCANNTNLGSIYLLTQWSAKYPAVALSLAHSSPF